MSRKGSIRDILVFQPAYAETCGISRDRDGAYAGAQRLSFLIFTARPGEIAAIYRLIRYIGILYSPPKLSPMTNR